MTPVEVEVVTEVGSTTVDDLGCLLPQVSSSAPPLTEGRVREVVTNPATDVFLASIDDRAVGMALLLTCSTLAGRFGLVEEVAVDSSARGQHVSVHLMVAVLRRAAELDLKFVDLTSRPSREAANALYRKVGFEVRDTNCYRHQLTQLPEPW